jgi:hypothetical protein
MESSCSRVSGIYSTRARRVMSKILGPRLRPKAQWTRTRVLYICNFKWNFILQTIGIKAMNEFKILNWNHWTKHVLKYYRFSTIKNRILQENIKTELGHNLELVLDVKNRWNSLADMISMFLKPFKFIKEAWLLD